MPQASASGRFVSGLTDIVTKDWRDCRIAQRPHQLHGQRLRFSLGNLKLQQPQLPRSEPDGQPTERSQLSRN
jgi:hypothetical protein